MSVSSHSHTDLSSADMAEAVDYRALIADDMAHVEALMREVVPGQSRALTEAIHHVLDSGGKRLRPTLTLLVCASYGTARAEQVWSLAAAVEMLHTATLVHDDLIDESLLRRGMPTINAMWSPGATVLTGDFLFARAAELAANTDNIRVITSFAQTLTVIVNGEIEQMFKGRGAWPSLEEYYARINAKTGVLFGMATGSAAILSGADDDAVRGLTEFGRHFGMAFQIVDDVLDIVGTAEQLGKPAGQDVAMGLVTLPVIHFARYHPDHPGLVALRNGERLNGESVAGLVSAIRESEAVRDALGDARRLVSDGADNLRFLPNGPHRRALEYLSELIVNRKF